MVQAEKTCAATLSCEWLFARLIERSALHTAVMQRKIGLQFVGLQTVVTPHVNRRLMLKAHSASGCREAMQLIRPLTDNNEL